MLILLLAAAALFVALRSVRHGSKARTPLLPRVLRRQPVDDVLDWIRFRVDTFPRRLRLLRVLRPLGFDELETATVYHDLPGVGIPKGRRTASTETRWNAMRPLIEELDVQSALDIGANIGWFAFALAGLGIPTIAVESQERHARVGLYARRRFSRPSLVSFLVMDVDGSTVSTLPTADCVLFLAVWHHIVRERGLDAASRLLQEIWAKANRVLFFETGERELPVSWGLPTMEPDPRAWLARYLETNCAGGRVIHLGYHAANIDLNGEPAQRSLFALVRRG